MEDDNVTEWQQLNKNSSSIDIYKEATTVSTANEEAKFKRLTTTTKLNHSQYKDIRTTQLKNISVEKPTKKKQFINW